jgi:hypothetical protein
VKAQKCKHGGLLKVKIYILFVEATHEQLLLYKDVWYNGRSWTCLHMLFESLCYFTKRLNVVMVMDFIPAFAACRSDFSFSVHIAYMSFVAGLCVAGGCTLSCI